MATEAADRIAARQRVEARRRQVEASTTIRDDSEDEMIVSFPEFIFKEFIAAVAMTAFLVVVSIVLQAPLLGQANPGVTPNPSKAPWYFLGLQELLSRFPPLMAGVAFPTFVIVLMILVPFLDRNPSRRPSERKVAIILFALYTAIVVALVIIGTFFRGHEFSWDWGWALGIPLICRPATAAASASASPSASAKATASPKPSASAAPSSSAAPATAASPGPAASPAASPSAAAAPAISCLDPKAQPYYVLDANGKVVNDPSTNKPVVAQLTGFIPNAYKGLGIDESGCIICHNGNRQATDQAGAHQNLVANPFGTFDKAPQLYENNCAQCHGATGEGGKGPPLNDQNRLGFFNDDYYYRCIYLGNTGEEHKGTIMPAWGVNQLLPKPVNDNINLLVHWIRMWQQYTSRP